MSALRDMFSPIALINDGITCSPNGANLNFNVSGGSLYGMGINWAANQKSPNKVDITARVPASFYYRTRNGGVTGLVSAIDPTKYDAAGTITTIPGGGNTSTNQRVYLYPTGAINIQYGQATYSNLTNAIAAQHEESFVKAPNAIGSAILIGILAVRKGATNLSNTNDAKFTPVSIFGETVGGTNGISTTTLQQAYENSVTPEIITNDTLGALSLKRGSDADTDAVLEIVNAAGSVTASITGAGNLAAGGITSNGVQVATLIDPVRTTLTGNGATSVYAISGASGLTNPSALIVAIDGILQEPGVDYTVGSGNITFTSPLPNGSKGVVVSPVNTVQVGQVTPSDGSVTSAKLDNSINFATRPTTSASGRPASNSLITRVDALVEEAMNVGFYVFGVNSAGGNSGTGSSQSRSGTSAAGWGRTLITSNAMRGGSSGGVMLRSDVPIAASAIGSIDVASGNNGGVVRLIVGDTGAAVGSAPATGNQDALSARGFGVEVYWSSVNNRAELKLFAHDGTSYITSAGVPFGTTRPTFQGTHTLVVASDGNGNISAYGDSTGGSFLGASRPVLLQTLSGGPSGNNLFGGSHVTAVITNHSTVAPSADPFFAIFRSKVVTGSIL
jgi:hypothetical protein